MNMAERMHRTAELERRHFVLGWQVKMMDALYSASRHLYQSDPWGARADTLLKMVAGEVVANCDRIWALSGGEAVSDDQADGASEEARDESLPF